VSRSRYIRAPTPTAEVKPLYEAVLQVLSGRLNVTQAARTVGLSRLRFQTRMHRGLTGLLEGLDQLPRGRPPKPEAEKALQEELAALRKENQQLSAQATSTVRMMKLATEWMHKGLRQTKRQTKTRPTAVSPSDGKDDEPARARLQVVEAMKAEGIPAPLAAAVVGISAPTVRRWAQRKRRGVMLHCPRGPAPAARPSSEASGKAHALLKDVKGCMGAAPLARATGLSRRDASAVKAAVLTQWEAERRKTCMRVDVSPGVVRGFDAIYAHGAPVLVSADGAVPYRTSVSAAARYDSAAVARAVADDFEAHGPPLVWRVDRWKAHSTDKVLDVLKAHQVLLLHGPPYFPRYYGQLERQNREHRAWLSRVGPCDHERLVVECQRMCEVFNELVPRRRLGWLTAAQAWRRSPKPVVDRWQLAAEVEGRRRKLNEEGVARGWHPGLAERLAIEGALIQRGLLRLTKGGWC
jgi:hypothetical protein